MAWLTEAEIASQNNSPAATVEAEEMVWVKLVLEHSVQSEITVQIPKELSIEQDDERIFEYLEQTEIGNDIAQLIDPTIEDLELLDDESEDDEDEENDYEDDELEETED